MINKFFDLIYVHLLCNKIYPVFKTLLASLMNACKLVPIKERQNTAMSTELLVKLV